MLTLTYAFELKWGPKRQYMLKELNTKKKCSPLFTPVARSSEGKWLIELQIMSMPILSVLFNREL